MNNKDPREFSCFDDHDNDGWNNSTIDRDAFYGPPYQENEPNEGLLDEEEAAYPRKDLSVVVDVKSDAFKFMNDEKLS